MDRTDRTAWWWKPRTQRKAEANQSFVFRAFRYQEDSEVAKREKETSWAGREGSHEGWVFSPLLPC